MNISEERQREQIDQSLKRILDALEGDDGGEKIVIFSRQEAEALKEVASVWQALRGGFKLASWLGGGLKWFIAFALAWGALKVGVLDWIKEGIK